VCELNYKIYIDAFGLFLKSDVTDRFLNITEHEVALAGICNWVRGQRSGRTMPPWLRNFGAREGVGNGGAHCIPWVARVRGESRQRRACVFLIRFGFESAEVTAVHGEGGKAEAAKLSAGRLAGAAGGGCWKVRIFLPRFGRPRLPRNFAKFGRAND
jgi:hypothetical protein